MQLGHGKGAPLRRLAAGDGIAYYSPTVHLGGKDRLQAFTAIGFVAEREPYRGDMGGGFEPWRRDVRWLAAAEAPIAPLLDSLALTSGRRNWGYLLRFGLVEIGAADFRQIAAAMGADPALPA
jgi:hypothetical protein